MHQMSLGELIVALRGYDPDFPVYFDFVHYRPNDIDSYRGYYEQIAIGYGHQDISVSELIKMCEKAIGQTFYGWKGGEFVMNSSTPLWVANPGESGGTAIVGIRQLDWRIILVTESIGPT